MIKMILKNGPKNYNLQEPNLEIKERDSKYKLKKKL